MSELFEHILISDRAVGIVGLQAALDEVAAMAIDNSDRLKVELLRLVRNNNYIPPEAEKSYAQGLLSAYRRYIGQEPEHNAAGLVVRVLGRGCPNCRRLAELTLNALAELELTADVEHVTDPARIAKYGLVGVPALVINGRICSSGRVPTKDQIKRWLEESD
jgi:hypothetical protein